MVERIDMCTIDRDHPRHDVIWRLANTSFILST